MKIIPQTSYRTRMRNTFTHSLFLGILTSASLVFSTLGLKVHAQNQSFNNTEITSYAQAVLAMEPARQQAFAKIKKIVGGAEVPKIVCSDPNTVNSLPGEAKEIAVNYCNYSQQIVADNGLTVDKFNNMTIQIQSNNNLKQQVYRALIRLQTTNNSQ